MKVLRDMKTPLVKNLEIKLTKKFSPKFLNIIDESHKHAGHAGIDESGKETHFKVIMVSASFANLSRMERQRMVHHAISKDIKLIHSITLALFGTEEKKEE